MAVDTCLASVVSTIGRMNIIAGVIISVVICCRMTCLTYPISRRFIKRGETWVMENRGVVGSWNVLCQVQSDEVQVVHCSATWMAAGSCKGIAVMYLMAGAAIYGSATCNMVVYIGHGGGFTAWPVACFACCALGGISWDQIVVERMAFQALDAV